ncbi:MAG TPA: peptidylprolyl isomerase [Burkholderiales bacterium]|nr:peptidylprolyl isomerase [Burkholderiales bacterium]
MHPMKLAAIVALTLAGAVAMPSSWGEDQTNVAVVNGVPIPQSRVDFVVKSQIQRSQGQQKDTPEFRQQVKDVLITREVIAQEATKEGLDKSPAVQTQLEMAKQDFVIQAYFEDFIKNNQPTDEQTRAEYEKIKAQQTGNGEKMEYKVRHILIKVDPNADPKKAKAAEQKAKAIVAELNKANGKNFAKLASTKSDDPGTKTQGGELDWTDGSNLVKEFTDAMVKLEKGSYTKTPVKTRFGYHIILLEDVRPIAFPPYDQVKDRVQQELIKQARDKKIDELRAAAKVE